MSHRGTPGSSDPLDALPALGASFAAAFTQVASVVQEAAFPGQKKLTDFVADAEAALGGATPVKTPHCSPEEFAKLLRLLTDCLTPDSVFWPHTPSVADAVVEHLRFTAETLVWGEKHDGSLFDIFCERQALAFFVGALLTPRTAPSIRVQLLQTLCILVQNARRDTSFYYLLSGGHLNKLLMGQPDLPNEECLAYFVAFLKSLALRLDGETAPLLLTRRASKQGPSPPLPFTDGNGNAGGFPLFMQAAGFATHREQMARTSARAACLCLLQLDHTGVQAAAVQATRQQLAPRLADSLRAAWAAAAAALRKKDSDALRAAFESEEDILSHFGELLQLKLPEVTEALASELMAGALLPLLASLAPVMQYPQPQDSRYDSPIQRPRRGMGAVAPPEPPSTEDALLQPPPAHSDSPAPAEEHISKQVRLLLPPNMSHQEDSQPLLEDSLSNHDHLTAVLAVRAIASCSHVLRQVGLTGLVVPLAQLLLWPAAPAALVAAVQDSDRTEMTSQVKAAFAAAAATFAKEEAVPLADAQPAELSPRARQAAGEVACEVVRALRRQHRLQGTPGLQLRGGDLEEPLSIFIPNPFRVSLLAMMQSPQDSSTGYPTSPTAMSSSNSPGNTWRTQHHSSAYPSPAVAVWALCELQAVLYPAALEDAGLLPPKAFDPQELHASSQSGDGSFLSDVLATGLSWLWGNSWAASHEIREVAHSTFGVPRHAEAKLPPLSDERSEGCRLECCIVAGLRPRVALGRQAQEALAAILVELASSDSIVLAHAAGYVAANLEEAAGVLLGAAAAAEAACSNQEMMQAGPRGTPPGSTISDPFGSFDGLNASPLPSSQASLPSRLATEGPGDVYDARLEAASSAAEQLVTAFLEEWSWHQEKINGSTLSRGGRLNRKAVDQLAFACGSEESWISAGKGKQGQRSSPSEDTVRHASRTLLTLRRLEAEFVSLGELDDGSYGQIHTARLQDAEGCPVVAEPVSLDASELAQALLPSHAAIPCFGPASEIWSFVPHPAALIIQPSGDSSFLGGSRLRSGSAASLCVPIWRVTARPSVSDPLLLRLRICQGHQRQQSVQRTHSAQGSPGGQLNAFGNSINGEQTRTGERLLSIRFQDSAARARALSHLREHRVKELQKLLAQIARFARHAAASAHEDVRKLKLVLHKNLQRRTSMRQADLGLEMCQRSTSSVPELSGLCGREPYTP
eukprot:TRINITY_DN106556_c0_g1_i1.p1 TRINITY_DN106556_c0_g1~~TRINITY_DN106556_c0_g1_i1.p1  ORF type:complete len:1235 (-),score=271.10 TRINITY_DN106556_c0_g1_i1:14-3616(-)